MNLTHRKTCRVCGSYSLTKVIDLGEQYLQGFFVKPGQITPTEKKFPTSLVLCRPLKDKKACGLLQMEFSIPPEILYSVYWYRSGINNTMRMHLGNIANDAAEIIGKAKALVLDIGCNDGTLLNSYPKEFKKIGIDPSNIAKSIQGDIKVVEDFFPSKKLANVIQEERCDIITSIAMFYDLENPIEFTKAIKNILAPTGIWILEMSYMPTMLKTNSYDTICHEHLEYYSLIVIEYILKQAGLKIFNATLNTINGGSLRCYVTHENNLIYQKDEYMKNIQKIFQEESTLELNTEKPYKDFQDRITIHKKELNALLKKLKSEGKKIHIYGASTKGNTILQWCEIDNKTIDVAAERNPDKFGAFTLGTNIPIVSEKESRVLKPDYYLVLPWHFKEEFIEREKETLNKGIGLIFPLPQVEIVTK
ncbi:MAG: methyltransferase [Candidatus Melainabacteria bacterium RIFCSPLOWO2_02_FULL_35_15]|nr:MAG: methyltransferase [Candidatus Melainabacteria bacterium RIFCSPLOWO2_12_FULL_35_11]OGI14569.1 MAG: methyltransferase [Candidatus Melainabacteria bacterium RIFCSPLOWO2_02_FULL_35_15]